MDLNAVKQFIEQNQGNDDVKAYLQGLNPLTVDGVQKYLTENQDAKKWFDSERDKHFSKGLETWKTNNLSKLIDDEVKKRFPDKDPKDAELEKIKVQLAQMEAEKVREKLTNVAIKTATEKKIPVSVVDFLIGEDEDSTFKNLAKFEEIMNPYVQEAVEERMKKGAYTPPKNNNDNNQPTGLADALKQHYTK